MSKGWVSVGWYIFRLYMFLFVTWHSNGVYSEADMLSLTSSIYISNWWNTGSLDFWGCSEAPAEAARTGESGVTGVVFQHTVHPESDVWFKSPVICQIWWKH